ncbi:MAG: caspase family protein [Pseudomonadota bacterium]
MSLYALFVGIDAYPQPVSPLEGCVNDVRAVEAALKERLAGEEFHSQMLTDAQATRKGIIEAFRSHLGKAKKDDIALFYYSGHGSQQPSPPEFWHLEPDRLDETLVCYDSRSEDWDLADKELAQLIYEVSQKCEHIVVILDACHSGSGTRALEEENAEEFRARLSLNDDRLRPLDTFIVSKDNLQTLAPNNAAEPTASGWLNLPVGRHIVLSACKAEETAKETRFDGEWRGVFSYYLLQTLQHSGSGLTYRDLFKRLESRVRSRISDQLPQIEAVNTTDLTLPFLGRAVSQGKPYYTLSHSRDNGWMIDGGGIHGIQKPVGDETTVLSLFAADAPIENLSQQNAVIGEAHVIEVMPGSSKVSANLTDGELDDVLTYKAVVSVQPLPAVGVALEGDMVVLDQVRQGLSQAALDNTASLFVRESALSEARLLLKAENNKLSIRRVGDFSPLVVDIEGSGQEQIDQAIQRLEHIARWLQTADLSNEPVSLKIDAVQLKIYNVDPVTKTEEEVADSGNIRFSYRLHEGKWLAPQYKIKLINTTEHELHCALLGMTESYDIEPGLLPGGSARLKAAGTPEAELWAINGYAIEGYVPDEFWNNGLLQINDMLKLIVSTEPLDGTLLQQGELDIAVDKENVSGTRGDSLNNPLSRLMGRMQTRAMKFGGPPAALADWVTSERMITVVRPLEAADVSQASRLSDNLRLQAHGSLKATARLTSQSEATRDVADVGLPAWLRNNPEVAPFELVRTRGGAPGLNVLELSDVQNPEAVTAEAPLVLEADTTLAENEHVLAVTYDGEFHLPVGFAKAEDSKTTIYIHHLPDPVPASSRDVSERGLSNSLKIYFQKVLSDKFDRTTIYPLLNIAEPDGDDDYEPPIANTDTIKQKVAAANKIVLYIHGIIGETQGMVASAQPDWVDASLPAVTGHYDLILNFDYESIGTHIEETARDLKAKLAEVGLDADHGKTLHIIAHSMGGLVSRWFIEREGGKDVVQHLIMLGTPNQGSPWPTAHEFATVALSIGLNRLGTIFWPATVLGYLVKATESIDVALDQMTPNSGFMKNLAQSSDPGVPYTIIAGNTSLIPAALEGGDAGLFGKLLRKLKLAAYDGLDLLFFNKPNDIAVSVTSIHGVPEGRNPPPHYVDAVACDHVSYFSTKEGLEALGEVVQAL